MNADKRRSISAGPSAAHLFDGTAAMQYTAANDRVAAGREADVICCAARKIIVGYPAEDPLPDEVRKGPWLTAMTRYEGFPLALRVRPNADTSANRAALTSLGVVAHQLAHVRDNGLPESEYNNALQDFDLALQAAMEGEGAGAVVLIETFAGKRNYYAYVDACATFRSRVESLRQEFQTHQLTVECRTDSSWTFYERYRKDFPW